MSPGGHFPRRASDTIQTHQIRRQESAYKIFLHLQLHDVIMSTISSFFPFIVTQHQASLTVDTCSPFEDPSPGATRERMPRSAARTESRYRNQLDPADVVSQPRTHLEIRHAEALARKASIVKISSGAGSEKGGLNRVY
jgi:hypothetical protein